MQDDKIDDDREWYRERLADPTIVDDAVEVMGRLAVPVRGSRRGGFVQVRDSRMADQVIRKLSASDGFPRLRYVPGTRRRTGGDVWWGEDPPAIPERDDPEAYKYVVDEGWYFGYSDDAIHAHIHRLHEYITGQTMR